MDGLEKDTQLLRAIAAFYGLTPAALAREIGVARTTINRTFNASATTRLSQPTLEKLEKRFPEFPWDDPSSVREARLPFKSVAPTRDPNSVAITEIDAAFGMGDRFFDTGEVATNTINFDRRWLRKYTSAAPDEVFFARGIGDSMMPTLLDSDILLIDTSQKSLRSNDHIWAVSYGDLGMVKRLRAQPDGSLLVLSDNAAIADFPASDGELTIIGRIVAFERKL